jgi:hypothetical protein
MPSEPVDPRTINSPMPLELFDKDDNPVTFYPKRLTDEDITFLDEYVRAEHMKLVRAAIHDDDSPEVRRQILQDGLDSAASLTWMSGRGKRYICNPAGFAMLAYRCCRDSTKLTYEEFKALFYNSVNLRRWHDRWEEVQLRDKGGSTSATEKKSPKDQRAARRRREKTSTTGSRRTTSGPTKKSRS